MTQRRETQPTATWGRPTRLRMARTIGQWLAGSGPTASRALALRDDCLVAIRPRALAMEANR